MSDLKIGDIVKLKSGGPNMTIESIDDTKVTCKWFVGTYQTKIFEENLLERSKPQEQKFYESKFPKRR